MVDIDNKALARDVERLERHLIDAGDGQDESLLTSGCWQSACSRKTYHPWPARTLPCNPKPAVQAGSKNGSTRGSLTIAAKRCAQSALSNPSSSPGCQRYYGVNLRPRPDEGGNLVKSEGKFEVRAVDRLNPIPRASASCKYGNKGRLISCGTPSPWSPLCSFRNRGTSPVYTCLKLGPTSEAHQPFEQRLPRSNRSPNQVT